MAEYRQILHTVQKFYFECLNSLSCYSFVLFNYILKKDRFFLIVERIFQGWFQFCNQFLPIGNSFRLINFEFSVEFPLGKNKLVSYIAYILLILWLLSSNGPYGRFACKFLWLELYPSRPGTCGRASGTSHPRH